MKVSEVMTKAPATCSADTSLGNAAEIMVRHNCGILPVIGSQKELAGVVTDRDVCAAVATRNRLPSEITVREIASPTTHSCRPDDDIRTALRTMTKNAVRRLPVVDSTGKLAGIISTDDIVLRNNVRAGQDSELSAEELVNLLQNLVQVQLNQPQPRQPSPMQKQKTALA